jgi:hypothetical protein
MKWVRSTKHLQRGQSSMEYVVVCSALALGLGLGMVDDASALKQFLALLKLAYEKFTFALSLPG